MQDLRHELEQFYEEHEQHLFTFALSMTRDHGGAEDAVHEAFSRLLQMRESPRNLKSYVFRAVRNAAIDGMRRTARLRELTDEDAHAIFDGADDPRRTMEKRIFQNKVEEALKELSDDERKTIIHHLYADLTFREISEIFDCPLATVTSRYRRGLERLRERLEER